MESALFLGLSFVLSVLTTDAPATLAALQPELMALAVLFHARILATVAPVFEHFVLEVVSRQNQQRIWGFLLFFEQRVDFELAHFAGLVVFAAIAVAPVAEIAPFQTVAVHFKALRVAAVALSWLWSRTRLFVRLIELKLVYSRQKHVEIGLSVRVALSVNQRRVEQVDVQILTVEFR